MPDKLLSMREAVERFVPDGSRVACGLALEAAIPFAFTHELIRRRRRDLHLVGTRSAPGSDIAGDHDGDVVFVGMRLPLLAFALAVSTHAPEAVGVFENGVMRDTPPRGPVVTMSDPPNLDGALWAGALSRAMGLLAGGHVDVGFIGGAQIDRHANLNTTRIGPAEAPAVRLPGSGGGCDIACAARRLLVVMAHEQRRFVARVDHRTSPGYGDGPGWRARVGLPACESVTLITTRAVLRAAETGGSFELVSVHPGEDAAVVVDDTPWGWPDPPVRAPAVTLPPSAEVLQTLRALDPDRVWTGDG